MLQKAQTKHHADSENTRRLLEIMYFIGLDVHHEDNQLLREGRGWLCVSRRQDRIDPLGAG